MIRRSVLTLLIWGSRVSLFVGILATVISIGIAREGSAGVRAELRALLGCVK